MKEYKETLPIKDKMVLEHSIKCTLCNEIFIGRTQKEADKNFHQHYLFKHSSRRKEDDN